MQQGFLTGLVALVLTTGCSSTSPGHAGHHAEGTDPCAGYRAAMAGKSPEEQRALAEAHIVEMHGSSDAAHVERHMKMMERRCGVSVQDPPKG